MADIQPGSSSFIVRKYDNSDSSTLSTKLTNTTSNFSPQMPQHLFKTLFIFISGTLTVDSTVDNKKEGNNNSNPNKNIPTIADMIQMSGTKFDNKQKNVFEVICCFFLSEAYPDNHNMSEDHS